VCSNILFLAVRAYACHILLPAIAAPFSTALPPRRVSCCLLLSAIIFLYDRMALSRDIRARGYDGVRGALAYLSTSALRLV